MAKRRTILTSVVCLSIAVLTVQTLSQTLGSSQPSPPDLERLPNIADEERNQEIEKMRGQGRLDIERMRNMTEQERKRYLEKRRRQRELERQRSSREARKRRAEREREMAPLREQRKLESEQRRREFDKEKEEAGGFIFAKYALGATDEQWKPIQAKLEKVRLLRDQASSGVGAYIAGGSSDGGAGPVFQWKKTWKDKALRELTEAQRLARQLRALVERKNTTPEAFRRKMAALRKARSKEAEIERQLVEARRELREILTTHQEAVLVLMKWF